MMREIKILAGLNLRNIFGINVFRHTKDKNAKKRSCVLMAAWLILIAMAAFYAGALSLGYIQLGMGEVVPAYLITIASVMILFFDIFKAGPVIFSEKGYEIISSLPLSEKAIVIGRFIRMYAENLTVSAVVMVPGLAVYAYLLKPSAIFYIFAILVTVLLPLAPMTLATAFGAAVTAVTSRMKHKGLAGSALTIGAVCLLMVGSGSLTSFEGELTEEMLVNLADLITQGIKSIYPPAVWMGEAIIGASYMSFALWTAVSMAALAAMIAIVSANFHAICRSLHSVTAKHNYRMESLRQSSVLASLYKREMKRYFASSIYVTNTIIGPILGLIMSAALLVTGKDAIGSIFPVPVDINGLMPFLLAAVFGMMSTTSVSISMEGKEWWIVKSLPLTTRTILDSKILMNLSLTLPMLAVSDVLLIAALKPSGLEILWILLIPAVLTIFSSIFGIAINLLFPVFNWENEAAVVKQSASSAIGGLGGMVAAVVCGVLYFLTPEAYKDMTNGAICIILTALAVLMYVRNSRVNLQSLE